MVLTAYQRDILARTVAGEAATPRGRAAVAAVIMNRANSGRYPSDPAAVALQKNQFSAWNGPSRGGNNIPTSISPSSADYRNAVEAIDGVFGGTIPDPTGGALNYYAPAGMRGRTPPWARGRNPTTVIEGQRFFGSSNPARLPMANVGETAAGKQMPLGRHPGQIQRGDAVKGWQSYLAQKGLYSGAIDGKYGKGTEAATIALQKQLKASGAYAGKIDGVVGPQTRTASGVPVASGEAAAPGYGYLGSRQGPAGVYTQGIPSQIGASGEAGAPVPQMQQAVPYPLAFRGAGKPYEPGNAPSPMNNVVAARMAGAGLSPSPAASGVNYATGAAGASGLQGYTPPPASAASAAPGVPVPNGPQNAPVPSPVSPVAAVSPTSVKSASAVDWYRAMQAGPATNRTIPLPGGLPGNLDAAMTPGVPVNPMQTAQSSGRMAVQPTARGGLGPLASSPPLSIQGGLGPLTGSQPLSMAAYQKMLANKGAAMVERGGGGGRSFDTTAGDYNPGITNSVLSHLVSPDLYHSPTLPATIAALPGVAARTATANRLATDFGPSPTGTAAASMARAGGVASARLPSIMGTRIPVTMNDVSPTLRAGQQYASRGDRIVGAPISTSTPGPPPKVAKSTVTSWMPNTSKPAYSAPRKSVSAGLSAPSWGSPSPSSPAGGARAAAGLGALANGPWANMAPHRPATANVNIAVPPGSGFPTPPAVNAPAPAPVPVRPVRNPAPVGGAPTKQGGLLGLGNGGIFGLGIGPAISNALGFQPRQRTGGLSSLGSMLMGGTPASRAGPGGSSLAVGASPNTNSAANAYQAQFGGSSPYVPSGWNAPDFNPVSGGASYAWQPTGNGGYQYMTGNGTVFKGTSAPTDNRGFALR